MVLFITLLLCPVMAYLGMRALYHMVMNREGCVDLSTYILLFLAGSCQVTAGSLLPMLAAQYTVAISLGLLMGIQLHWAELIAKTIGARKRFQRFQSLENEREYNGWRTVLWERTPDLYWRWRCFFWAFALFYYYGGYRVV